MRLGMFATTLEQPSMEWDVVVVVGWVEEVSTRGRVRDLRGCSIGSL